MSQKPTSRQLSYLKTLAEKRGQSFAYPQTMAEASQEINRLKHIRPDSYADQRRERKQIADQIQAGPVNTAAKVRADEVTGYGSSATWIQNREQDPPVPEDPGPPEQTRRRPVVGKRTELGSYTADGQRRVNVGQRVDGVVRFQPEDGVVLDRPLDVSEDGICRPRQQGVGAEREHAARRKRPNAGDGGAEQSGRPPTRRGVTGHRVELARYRISAGER